MLWSKPFPSTVAARGTPSREQAMKPDIYFHIRQRAQRSELAIGPGKIALLEAIAHTGSITAAAKLLKMSYRRAWTLVDETNRSLISPAVLAVTGGRQGGATSLTQIGNELVSRYRALEQQTATAAAEQFDSIVRQPSRALKRSPDARVKSRSPRTKAEAATK